MGTAALHLSAPSCGRGPGLVCPWQGCCLPRAVHREEHQRPALSDIPRKRRPPTGGPEVGSFFSLPLIHKLKTQSPPNCSENGMFVEDEKLAKGTVVELEEMTEITLLKKREPSLSFPFIQCHRHILDVSLPL